MARSSTAPIVALFASDASTSSSPREASRSGGEAERWAVDGVLVAATRELRSSTWWNREPIG